MATAIRDTEMAMHPELDARLKLWKTALNELRKAEHVFRTADATRKSIFAQLVLKAEGKSIAEREYNALATEEWQNFAKALADAETDYNFHRCDYELKQNAFYGMLASIKRESDHIDKKGA